MITHFNDEAVAATFARVLGRLSPAERATIEQRVSLATDDRYRAAKHGGDVGGLASVSPSGVLWLDSGELKRESRHNWRYIESAMAHELAHIALGHHTSSAKALGHAEGEYAADKLAVSWGYDSLVSYDTLHPQSLGGLRTFGQVEF